MANWQNPHLYLRLRPAKFSVQKPLLLDCSRIPTSLQFTCQLLKIPVDALFYPENMG